MTKSTGARFWAVDLHTHTPASQDVKSATYGATSATEFVNAAIDAGLNAIAVTDHNTSLWCDDVSQAAEGTELVVLPGVEISTTEGHLLAVWEQGTPGSVVSELLVRLGIKGVDQGKLDISAEVGFAHAAKEVADSGGLAIAAHVDRDKGLLGLEVAAHVKKTLLCHELSAVEIVDLSTQSVVNGKTGKERNLACVRGSDCTMSGKSYHLLSGIGSRRTWIKASKPDLIGIRHALKDPDLRVRLEESQTISPHPVITSISVKGSFLNEEIFLSQDMNCFLGGTGAGKSLILEALRFVCDQQVDAGDFPAISEEVLARLEYGLGAKGVVRLSLSSGGESFMIERTFASETPTPPVVRQLIGDSWTEIDVVPSEIIKLAAFSQGEILEFSRQPVGRMSLLDSDIDFDELNSQEDDVLRELRENSERLREQRELVEELKSSVTKEESTKERVDELSTLFDSDVVKQQEGWTKDSTKIARLIRSLPDAEGVELKMPKAMVAAEVEANQDLFDRIETERSELEELISNALNSIADATRSATARINLVKSEWDARQSAFKDLLDEELESVKDGSSLRALRSQLEAMQLQLDEILAKKSDLEDTEAPALSELHRVRDEMLDRLMKLRDEKRRLRRARAVALNSKMAGIVKLDVSNHPDSTQFREALEDVKRGSRVKEPVLDAIANRIHPFRFVRALLASDIQSLVDEKNGIDLGSLARILANIEDHDAWTDLLEAQICDMPDRLDIKFRKPDDGTYAPIEKLAHGQRCTAILVVLLADGVDPVVVDQPEDALHAPWIETYLVDRLRTLRGERQYIFATRSPGIVVGGDAEQIITMRATSGRGEVEATGSLERHDLNKLSLHHLEGGSTAFKRRSGKLEVSVES
jgi:hypothetical protein